MNENKEFKPYIPAEKVTAENDGNICDHGCHPCYRIRCS